MSKFNKIEFESDVHDLHNAIKVLSCVKGYSTEHPDRPRQRSDHNLDVSRYHVDAPALLTSIDRVAELSERLYEKVMTGCSTARIEHNDTYDAAVAPTHHRPHAAEHENQNCKKCWQVGAYHRPSIEQILRPLRHSESAAGEPHRRLQQADQRANFSPSSIDPPRLRSLHLPAQSRA